VNVSITIQNTAYPIWYLDISDIIKDFRDPLAIFWCKLLLVTN